MPYFKRAITSLLMQNLNNMPAVFLNGPRQAGKSTLVSEIAKNINAEYVTLDNIATFASAETDPVGFLRILPKPLVIDEIQRAPNLARVIKQEIDEFRLKDKKHANGQFLLTGSTNLMALPGLSDALVGRMQVLTLYPLSAGEVNQKHDGFIETVFSKEPHQLRVTEAKITFEALIKKASFPEIASNPGINANQWFESYLTTLLQRDIRQLAEIDKITALPNMLKLIAARAGSLLNDTSLARDLGLNSMTYRRYRLLLSNLFLLITVPPWFRNINKRLVKSPKLFFTDTALLCHLLGFELDGLKKQAPHLFGLVIENFVASELTKQLALLNDGTLYHFRTQDNKEIDFIIEKRDGRLAAIEVKSRETINASDFTNLKLLRETLGKDFIKGIVIYLGKETLPFGDKLCAMPITALWNLGAQAL